MAKVRLRAPIPVQRAFRDLGNHVSTARKLQGVTAAQLAERAGVSMNVLRGLEHGTGAATLETFLRVARVLGSLDGIAKAVDPFETELGRLRAEETLPQRVRPKRLGVR